VFRALTDADREAALTLWDRCFGPGRDYFDRYFGAADPWNRVGDTVGAWAEGRLVSAAHVCRRPVEWGGRTLLCGAIANVATDPDFRRRGLSRELLRLLITRMESEGFDYSLLFTGAYGHYEPLGWAQTVVPRAVVSLTSTLPPDPGLPLLEGTDCAALYAALPGRPLRTARPAAYQTGWVEWNWRELGAAVFGSPEVGFGVVGPAKEAPDRACLYEWHARNAATEAALLLAAAHRARVLGRTELSLLALPAYGAASLRPLGEVRPEHGVHGMLRNVGLSDAEFAEVRRCYASGEAVWWYCEAF